MTCPAGLFPPKSLPYPSIAFLDLPPTHPIWTKTKQSPSGRGTFLGPIDAAPHLWPQNARRWGLKEVDINFGEIPLPKPGRRVPGYREGSPEEPGENEIWCPAFFYTHPDMICHQTKRQLALLTHWTYDQTNYEATLHTCWDCWVDETDHKCTVRARRMVWTPREGMEGLGLARKDVNKPAGLLRAWMAGYARDKYEYRDWRRRAIAIGYLSRDYPKMSNNGRGFYQHHNTSTESDLEDKEISKVATPPKSKSTTPIPKSEKILTPPEPTTCTATTSNGGGSQKTQTASSSKSQKAESSKSSPQNNKSSSRNNGKGRSGGGNGRATNGNARDDEDDEDDDLNVFTTDSEDEIEIIKDQVKKVEEQESEADSDWNPSNKRKRGTASANVSQASPRNSRSRNVSASSEVQDSTPIKRKRGRPPKVDTESSDPDPTPKKRRPPKQASVPKERSKASKAKPRKGTVPPTPESDEEFMAKPKRVGRPRKRKESPTSSELSLVEEENDHAAEPYRERRASQRLAMNHLDDEILALALHPDDNVTVKNEFALDDEEMMSPAPYKANSRRKYSRIMSDEDDSSTPKDRPQTGKTDGSIIPAVLDSPLPIKPEESAHAAELEEELRRCKEELADAKAEVQRLRSVPSGSEERDRDLAAAREEIQILREDVASLEKSRQLDKEGWDIEKARLERRLKVLEGK